MLIVVNNCKNNNLYSIKALKKGHYSTTGKVLRDYEAKFESNDRNKDDPMYMGKLRFKF